MNNKKIITSLLISLTLGFSAVASIFNLPIKKIGKTDFYIYEVTTKETIYGISKKLGISKDEIFKYNPSIQDGLKSNQKLFFPVSDFSQNKIVVEKTAPKPNEFHHLVERGETVYGLSKLYQISPDEIVRVNPGAADGLKSGQVLIIPQKTVVNAPEIVAQEQKKSSEIIFHTILKGETLFSLSKKYNSSIDNILSLNPGVSPTSFKINDVIRIQPDIIIPTPEVKPVTEFHTYKVERGDNFESVAKEQGVSVTVLKDANSDTKKLKKDNLIYVPKIKEVAPVEDKATEPITQAQINEIYDSIHVTKDNASINIALILPYMLNTTNPDKQAQLYTEFYKGFLLAVDSIKNNTDKEINILTFDTENSMDKINEILANPLLKTANVIITPDNSQQVDVIAAYAKDNNINLINTFALKNDGYNNNEHFFQVNIPHSYMYAEVINKFDKLFKEREIIFLNNLNDDKGEKDMIKELKSYITENPQIISQELPFSGTLKADDIEALMVSAGKYIIIPNSGTKANLARFSTALKRLKVNRPDIDFVVFGYPEWTTYNDYTNTFYKFDTYVYSRFYANPMDSDLKEFEAKYKRWYGRNLILAAPQFGLLGYDTGLYFIDALNENGNDFNKYVKDYRGIQNDFSFQRVSNWSGFINKSLYFIHYSPSQTIEKIRK